MIDSDKFDKYIKKKKKDPEYYRKIDLDGFTYPLTILTGCNGSGKSQTLKRLREKYKEEKIDCVSYSTSRDGRPETYVNAWNQDIESYREGLMACFRSEGERMHDLFVLWAEKTLLPILKLSDKPIRVLIDEADSGLSLDRLYFSLRPLIETILPMELNKQRDIKIVMTANSYEMLEVLKCRYSQIIWMPTGDVWKPESYEGFASLYRYYYYKMWEEKNEKI